MSHGRWQHNNVGNVLDKKEWLTDDSHTPVTLSATPTSPARGEEFYNENTDVVNVCDGSVWRASGGKKIDTEQASITSNFDLYPDKVLNLVTGDIYEGNETGLRNAFSDAVDHDSIRLPATGTDFIQLDSKLSTLRGLNLWVLGRE